VKDIPECHRQTDNRRTDDVPWHKSDLKSLDYVLFRSFSKIFHTKPKDVIDQCMSLFGCPHVIAVVNNRKVKFIT